MEKKTEKKKLGINTAAGIVDIVGAVLYLVALFVIVGAAINEVVGTTGEGSTQTIATVFMLFAIVGVVLHIVGLVQSKKVNLKITGHILGIVGHGIYVLLSALMGWAAMILCILAAIFTLMQKPVDK